MNVVLFASAFHPHVGGVEEHVRQLAHQLLARGSKVAVVTNCWPRSLAPREVFQGIPVLRLPLRTPERCWKSKLTYAATHALVLRRVTHLVRKFGMAVAHVHCISGNAHYAHLAARRLGVPLVITSHGEQAMYRGRTYLDSPFMQRVLENVTRDAAAITGCSSSALRDLAASTGTAIPDGRVISNGVNLDEFQRHPPLPRSRPFVLGLGRLIPKKGFDVLIKAFARAALPTHDLVLAGDGPERPALEVLARQEGVGERVTFPGTTDRATTVGLFKSCDYFVLPSRIEPQGIVNLEAMAAGKAIIASHVDGVPDLVRHGETGLLVPPGDAGALAQAMGQLAADPALRDELGRAGLGRSAQYAWSAIADQYAGLYRELETSPVLEPCLT